MRALDRSMLPDTNELACLACYLLSRGLTTKQVARFLGCSPSFIRKVRRVVQGPAGRHLHRVGQNERDGRS